MEEQSNTSQRASYFKLRKLWSITVILLLFCFASPVLIAGQQARDTEFPFQKIKKNLTKKQIQYIKNLPADTTYDWIQVPENYADPSSNKIFVFYQRINRSSKSQNQVPITFFYGGPGISPNTQIAPLRDLTKTQDLIIIHQRGTGLSAPLPPIDNKTNILRYRHYLSRSIVNDSELIRKKLFQDQAWIVTGQSFGSLIVQRYICLFPQSIHSAHAHGYAATHLPTPFAESRIIQHGKNVETYLKAYPKDLEKLEKIADYLAKNSFSPHSDKKIKIQGRQAFSFVSFIFMAMPKMWPQFTNMLNFICPEEVKHNNLDNVIQYMYFNPDMLFLGGKQDVLNTTFNRIEAYITNEQSLSDYYKDIFKKLEAKDIQVKDWLIGEEAVMHFCVSSPYRDIADQSDLGKSDPLLPKDISTQLRKHPQLAFYLYAGAQDSVAPALFFQDLVKACKGHINFKTLPGGHESFMNPQFWTPIYESAQQAPLKKAI